MPLPVTRPLLTVATLEFDEYHVILSELPNTIRVSVSYCLILSDVFLSATTFTFTVDVTPLVASIVIFAVPVPTA